VKVTVRDLRERAGEALAVCELQDVRLLSASARSSNPVRPGPFVVNAEIRVKGEDNGEEGIVYSFARYQLVAVLESDEQTEAWAATVEHVATYRKNSELKLTQDQLNSFALAIGVMNLHPYARESAQSLVSRMGYPPFTMDLLHPVTGLPDEDEIEIEPAT
jgi:hypothetical protein